MNEEDDALRQALQALPVVADHPSLRTVERRAAAIRFRRRFGLTAITMAATVTLIVPAAQIVGNLTGDPSQPAATGPSQPPAPTDPAGAGQALGCPATFEERYDIAEPHLTGSVSEVPGPRLLNNDLRLLWSSAAAPAPTRVLAQDSRDLNAEVARLYAECPAVVDQSAVVVDLEQDAVSRYVQIRRTATRHSLNSSNVRVLAVGSIDARVNDSSLPDSEARTAEWEAFGTTWTVSGDPLPDADISSLVENMKIVDGQIDLTGWSVARQADEVVVGTGGYGEPSPQSYDVLADGLELTVSQRGQTLWLAATIGTRLTAVNGLPALLTDLPAGGGWSVTWEPRPSTTATLSTAGSDPEMLLEVAQSVTVVPADEPRLAQAWNSMS